MERSLLYPLRGLFAWYLAFSGVAHVHGQASIDVDAQHAELERVARFLDASDPDSGLLAVEQLLRTLDEGADTEVLYYLRSFRSEQLYYHGLFDEAMSEAMAAERLAHKLEDSLLVANVLNIQGLIHENINDHLSALPFLRAALRWYPARATSRYSVTLPHQIHGNLGQSLTAVGRFDSAQYHLERSRTLAKAANMQRGVAIADWALGRLYQTKGETERAIPLLERSMELSLRTEQSDVVLENHIALAEAWFALGRKDRMQDELERGRLFEREYTITPLSRRDFHRRASKLLGQAGLPAMALEHGQVANQLDSVISVRNRQAILSTVRALLDRENDLEIERLQASLYAEALERTRLSRLFVIVVSTAAILVVVGLYMGYRSRQRHLRRMAALELLRAQQEATIAELSVREQVGRDMHDDMGAGLSGLKLKSELALRDETDPVRKARLQEIARRSEELIAAMRQIIWALNKEQGSLEDLVAYASGYARSYLAEHGLQVSIEDHGPWPPIELTSDQRRNLFLVLKECLHNVVKHARASRVDIAFALRNGRLELAIADNGVGLPAERTGAGNGLHNMRARMAQLHGDFHIENGQGTRVRCEMPVSHERSIAIAQHKP